MIEKINILKYYSNRGYVEENDIILKEYLFSIYINNNLIVELLTIPKKLRELVIGYMYTEGMIKSFEDIDTIDINEEKGIANIELKERLYNDKSTLVTTDSGDFRAIPYQFYNDYEKVKLNKIKFDPEVVIRKFQELKKGSDLFNKTGNVHSVQICKGDKTLYFAEDIGRYNAFDKCVGAAIIDGEDLSKTVVYTSGRIPSSIAMKTIRAGIPIIVSRSAPSDKTLKLAKEYDLTVIGFATKEKINIYNM